MADVTFHRAGNPEMLKVSDIKSVLEGFLRDNPEKDILFYVHGRSRTLEKEIRRSAEIEKVHGLKVLMMHWDSWSSTISRPTDHAENSGDELRDAVNENAPDAPYRNHKDWLSKVHLSERQYILMNKNDAILNASKLLDISRDNLFDDRIGLGIKFYYHSNKILASNVLYFDITRASGFAHAHFVSKNPEVYKIFRFIFSPKKEDENESLMKTKVSRSVASGDIELDPFFVIKNVYYFKD